MAEYRFFDPKYDEFLEHSGVPGMKWGVRNYQYTDGTWTELGKERRRIGDGRYSDKASKSKNVEQSLRDKKEREFIASIKDDVHEVNKALVFDKLNNNLNPFRLNNCGYCAVAYDLRRRGEDAHAKGTLETLNIGSIEEVYGKEFTAPKGTYYGSGLTLKGCISALEVAKKANIHIRFPNDGSGFPDIGSSSNTSFERLKDVSDQISKAIRKESFTKPEIKRIENNLRSQGDGARGIIVMDWTTENGEGRLGHYFNYEVSNNLVYLVDAQDRTINHGLGGYLQHGNWCLTLRTDNSTINEEALSKLERIKHSDEDF